MLPFFLTTWRCELYIAMPQGFSYLSLLTDAYSRKIIGWAFQNSLKASGPLEALKQAIYSRRYPKKALIHHSDRGLQYCCH
ncbi:DDE-type integrase/transposase/recombinase [Chondrinema litorale]|uniref:DDE-type integrase/transposase/recombinase n=1 Tax=Chondrinema litorale TaxID=2994555 RepID=UPI003D6F8DFE